MKEEIAYPQILKMDDDWLDSSLKKKKNNYRLFSVVEHRGVYAHKGHYVNYTLDNNDKWIFYNDNKFRVFDPDYVEEQQAYILFYEIVD